MPITPLFPFTWTSDSALTITTLGPFWVSSIPSYPIRSAPIDVQPIHVQPGKVWDSNLTIETFRAEDSS